MDDPNTNKLILKEGSSSLDIIPDAQSNQTMEIQDLNLELFDKSYQRIKFFEAFSYDLRSFFYLLKEGKVRQAINFLFTKTFVPTGEGSSPWLYNNILGDFVRKYPEKVPLPRFIEVETTTVCNKRCFICEYVHWKPGDQVKRHLSFEEFKHIVDQFPSIRWCNLTGEGSSFLNKDYPKMIKYMHDKFGASIWLVDHLSDITFEQLEQDVFPYVHGIYVSIDGAKKETYEKIKEGCNFDNVITNLKKIVEYKRKNRTPFPHISFRYIILKENIREMPLVLDLINSIAFGHEWGGTSTWVEFTGLLYFPEIQSHYVKDIPKDVIEELRKRKEGIRFSFAHAVERLNPPIDECIAWMEPYIMLPGYVLPCCAVLMSNKRPFLREYSFGNVFEKDFKEIWANDYYTKFRKMVVDPCAPVPKICVGCRAFRTQERIAKYGIWDHLAESKEEKEKDRRQEK